MNNLGVAHYNQRSYQQARDYAREAVALSRAQHGPEHRETAKALGNLGMFESYLGDNESALEHTRQSIDLVQKIEGPHSVRHAPVALPRPVRLRPAAT